MKGGRAEGKILCPFLFHVFLWKINGSREFYNEHMIFIKKLLLKIVEFMPYPLIRFAYKLPAVARMSSRFLEFAITSGDPIMVTIKKGPLAGKKLQIDSQVPHYYWIKGHDEPDVLRTMQDLIKPGYRVVDVGAHIGIETLILSQLVGNKGIVVSIEPDPKNYELLSTNVRLHGVTNVQLMKVAISNHSGLGQFAQEQGVMSHLIGNPDDSGVAPKSLISVNVHTLDELFTSKKIKVDFVKIDVEDSEVSVLRGAQNLLKEQSPILIIELHSHKSAKGCAEILRQTGYKLELVDSPVKDIDLYLTKQPLTSYIHGFQRCHLLARPPRDR